MDSVDAVMKETVREGVGAVNSRNLEPRVGNGAVEGLTATGETMGPVLVHGALRESSREAVPSHIKKKRIRRSGVWEYFEAVEDENGKAIEARCCLCSAKYRNPNGTGTLSLHAKKHGYQPSPEIIGKDPSRGGKGGSKPGSSATGAPRKLTPDLPRDQRRLRRSFVWEYFTPIVDGKGYTVEARCKFCDCSYKNPNGTGTLIAHARKHGFQKGEAPTATNPAVPRRADRPTATLRERKKAKRSNAWEYFTVLENETGRTVEAQCKFCSTEYKNPSISRLSSHAKKHGYRQIASDGDAKTPKGATTTILPGKTPESKARSFHTALLDWIVNDNQFCDVVESSWFQELLRVLDPAIEIPNRAKVCLALKERASVSKANVIESLKKISNSRFAISLRLVPTTHTGTFASVEAHWIDSCWIPRSCVLLWQSIPDNYSPKKLSLAIYEALVDWELTSKISTITTDTSCLSLESCRLLYDLLPKEGVLVPERDKFVILCFSHLIYDGVRECLSIIQDQLDVLRNAVKRIYKSTEYIQQFQKAAAEHGLDDSDALQPDITERWYASVHFLSKAVKFRRPIETVLAKEGHLWEGLHKNVINWKSLEAISLFLDKVVTVAATSKDSSCRLTLSIAAVALQRLVAYCDEALADTASQSSTGALQTMAGSLKLKLSKWISDQSHRIELARICDPRFSTRDEKKESIRSLLLEQYDSQGLHSDGKVAGQHQQHPKGMDELLDFGRDNEVQEEKNDEVENYFTMTFYRDKKSDLFDWWKLNEHRFPRIGRIARDTLSIPATLHIDALELRSKQSAAASDMLESQQRLVRDMQLVSTINSWEKIPLSKS